jgi:glyoxylase-like metal-dependent hydrolase (beta-lactamase superfamily II)
MFVTAGAGVFGVAILGACGGSSSGGSGGASASGSSAAPSATETGPLDWKRVTISFVSAYLLVRGNEMALVDTGTTMSDLDIGEALKAAGKDWNQIKHVIFTHKHDDHVGGWESVQPHVKATAYAGEADLASISTTQEIKAVKDGDEIFGLRIVATPGHTAGHISVFDADTGVLVAGDAIRTDGGILEASNPSFTEVPADVAGTVKKLAALKPKTILFGHGEPLTANAAAELTKLAGATT